MFVRWAGRVRGVLNMVYLISNKSTKKLATVEECDCFCQTVREFSGCRASRELVARIE